MASEESGQELGRIEKPDAASAVGKRNVYLVTMVSPLPGAPEGYTIRLKNYWDAIDTAVSQLEARAGMVKHIFHEAVSVSGDLGLNLVSQVNQPAWSMIKSRMEAGATLEAFDNDELFSQIIDWSRCLQVGLTSQIVADIIQEKYAEASQARYDGMSKAIEEKLGNSETAMVIMSSTRGVTMPEGTEQYNVVPPELDELMRWTREAGEKAAAEAQQAAEAAQADQQSEDTPEDGGSVLWTPGSN